MKVLVLTVILKVLASRAQAQILAQVLGDLLARLDSFNLLLCWEQKRQLFIQEHQERKMHEKAHLPISWNQMSSFWPYLPRSHDILHRCWQDQCDSSEVKWASQETECHSALWFWLCFESTWKLDSFCFVDVHFHGVAELERPMFGPLIWVVKSADDSRLDQALHSNLHSADQLRHILSLGPDFRE